MENDDAALVARIREGSERAFNLLIDRHPQFENVVLVGAGSGHGFKHGPAVGRYTAALVTGSSKSVEVRFSLGSKTEKQRRDVH